jgi:hypothetical protein
MVLKPWFLQVMALGDLQLLDLSHNRIEVCQVGNTCNGGWCFAAASSMGTRKQRLMLTACLQVIPKNLFPNVAKLTTINFEDNLIKILPSDISELR